jgi:hypothetical protein
MVVAPESSSDPATTDRSKHSWPPRAFRQFPRLAAVGGVIAAVYVAWRVLVEDLEPDEAVAGTLVGLAALVILVLAFVSGEWLEALLGRVKGLKLAGFEVQLDAFQKVADETSTTQSDDEPADTATLLDLKVNLENKLAYIANNIINADKSSDPLVGYVTLGSLKKGEGLLTNEQAQVAYEVLGMQQHDLELLPPHARQVFFSGASALVNSLRITVFANLVYKRLKIPRWKRQRVPGDLRDIVIRSTDSDDPTVHHIVPIIASKKATFVYGRALEVLNTAPRSAGPRGRRFILVPATFAEKQDSQLLSVEPGGEIADDAWSVTLYALLYWLDNEPVPS